MVMVTPLPNPPQSTAPTTFNSDADTFLAALPQLVTQINQVVAGFNAAQSGTSTTSLTIGAGSQSLTTQAGLGFLAGQSVFIAATADPTKRMAGAVTSYNSSTGALAVTVTSTAGSGTFASWTVGMNAMSIQTATDVAAVLGYTPTPDTFRNRIVNGRMEVDQRNSGSAVAIAAGQTKYVIDKFKFSLTVASGSGTGQQSLDAPAGFITSLSYTVGTARVTTAAEFCAWFHGIEGWRIADMGWGAAAAQPVTIGFWKKEPATGTYPVAVVNSAFSMSYVTTYTITTANTWEYHTVTIPGPTSGTWNANVLLGAFVVFDQGSGSNFSTTAGAWAAGNFLTCPGVNKTQATAAAVTKMTGLSFVPGTSATPIEWRPYDVEKAACKRFFNQFTAASVAFGANSLVGFAWPVEMATTPAMSVSTGGTVGSVRTTSNGAVVSLGTFSSGASPTGTLFLGATGSPLTIGASYDFLCALDCDY